MDTGDQRHGSFSTPLKSSSAPKFILTSPHQTIYEMSGDVNMTSSNSVSLRASCIVAPLNITPPRPSPPTFNVSSAPQASSGLSDHMKDTSSGNNIRYSCLVAPLNLSPPLRTQKPKASLQEGQLMTHDTFEDVTMSTCKASIVDGYFQIEDEDCIIQDAQTTANTPVGDVSHCESKNTAWRYIMDTMSNEHTRGDAVYHNAEQLKGSTNEMIWGLNSNQSMQPYEASFEDLYAAMSIDGSSQPLPSIDNLRTIQNLNFSQDPRIAVAELSSMNQISPSESEVLLQRIKRARDMIEAMISSARKMPELRSTLPRRPTLIYQPEEFLESRAMLGPDFEAEKRWNIKRAELEKRKIYRKRYQDVKKRRRAEELLQTRQRAIERMYPNFADELEEMPTNGREKNTIGPAPKVEDIKSAVGKKLGNLFASSKHHDMKINLRKEMAREAMAEVTMHTDFAGELEEMKAAEKERIELRLRAIKEKFLGT